MLVGLKDETKDEEVIAFIQPKDGISLKENELRAYLKTHLANFKLPKQIYFVEELPKNATGKVLKRVLKEKIEAGGFIRKTPKLTFSSKGYFIIILSLYKPYIKVRHFFHRLKRVFIAVFG